MPEAVSTEASKQEARSFERKPSPRDRQQDWPGLEGSILSLQHAAGNRAVSELLHSQLENSQLSGTLIQRHWVPCGSPEDPSFNCDEDEKENARDNEGLADIQTKLTVSHPGDAYEREADNVADLVMRMPNKAVGAISAAPTAVQRECAACSSGEELCPKCNEEEQINRSPESAGLLSVQRQLDISRKGSEGVSTQSSEVPGNVAASIRGIRGRGQSMPHSTRSYFEQRFGFDFSGVRVHVDQRAGETARSLQAKAFTIGHDVIFGTGQYSPETTEGRRLIAHELTHVVQQNRLSSLHAESNEMIPGNSENLRRKIQAAPLSIIQCDKIDHRQLTWDDFQAPVPKKATFEASTASDFRDPALKDLAPATVTTEDTGEECKVGKKTLTKFKATLGIDPEQIEVKAFMWQDKSWKKEWTTEKKAREEKCKAGLVKKCEAAFDKQFKKIAAQRKASVKECKAHFGASLKQATKNCKPFEKQCIKHFTSKQDPPFEMDVEGRTLSANTKKECSSVLLKECTNELMKSVTFSQEVEGEEATAATTKAECSTDFAQSFEDLLKAQAKWTGTMAGEDAEVTSKEECSKSFLDACATRLSDAASNALLKHEQGHFDITDAIATKTQDALRTLAATFATEVTACGEDAAIKKAKQEAKNQIKKLQTRYKAGRSEMSKKQKQYDKETNHGKVEEKQSEWEEKIAEGFSD